MRIGFGFDAHAFSDGRPLILGGVRIECPVGLAGHSDADVVSHAIADALLGAAALGDLGSRFPADDRWRGASSLDILAEATHAVRDAGFDVCNVDATIVAESPRLSPYVDDMVAAIAGTLGVDRSAVSIKATTSDRMGFTGRGEGIATLAVALIAKV